MRVGGTRELHSRFRLIAATNRDLWQEVRERRFRQDLLYRIAVFPLTLPPLRRRKQDILPLTNAFIRHFARRYGKTVPPLSETQAGELLAYAWPGNIRELRSLVERAVILHRGGGLPLLFGLHGGPAAAAGAASPGGPGCAGKPADPGGGRGALSAPGHAAGQRQGAGRRRGGGAAAHEDSHPLRQTAQARHSLRAGIEWVPVTGSLQRFRASGMVPGRAHQGRSRQARLSSFSMSGQCGEKRASSAL